MYIFTCIQICIYIYIYVVKKLWIFVEIFPKYFLPGLGRMEKAQKALLGVVDLQADPEALCALSYLATRESDSKEARAKARQYTVQAMYLGMKEIFRETGDRLRMLGSDFYN